MRKKKKILMVTSTYPRWDEDTTPPFIENLCKEISKEYEVHVLSPYYPNAAIKETKDGIQIFRYTYAPAKISYLAYGSGILENIKHNRWLLALIPLLFIFLVINLYKLNKKHNYSLIHAHWLVPQGFGVRLLQLISNKTPPIIFTSHGGDIFGLKGTLFTKLKQNIINSASYLTVVSSIMEKYCINQLGIDKAKISIAPMGVDLVKTFTPLTLDKNQSDKLIYVGRLAEKKGVNHLIHAMRIVLNHCPTATLTIIGDGLERASIEQLIEELGIKRNIQLLGAIPNLHIPPYLQAANIAIVPSIVAQSGDQEGLGLVCIEAMGCECAVVASRLPAILDMVDDGKTGLLTRPGDHKDLAEKILYFITHPSEARNMGREGRKFALQKFNWKAVGENYCSIYDKLV